MYRRVLFVFTLMSSCISQSFADINSDICEFYFRGESEKVKEVQDIFSKVADADAVKVCTSNTGRSAYFIASKISVKNGVSYFHLTRIFEEAVENEVRWVLVPPTDLHHITTHEVYMCDGSLGCVKQNDSRFVQTEGVAMSTFRELNSAWNNIAGSEKLFEKAVQDLPFWVKHSSVVKKLKSALYGKGDVPKLFSLTFNQGNDSNFPKYTFSVMTESDMWSIDFDFYFSDEIRFEQVVLIEG